MAVFDRFWAKFWDFFSKILNLGKNRRSWRPFYSPKASFPHINNRSAITLDMLRKLLIFVKMAKNDPQNAHFQGLVDRFRQKYAQIWSKMAENHEKLPRNH